MVRNVEAAANNILLCVCARACCVCLCYVCEGGGASCTHAHHAPLACVDKDMIGKRPLALFLFTNILLLSFFHVSPKPSKQIWRDAPLHIMQIMHRFHTRRSFSFSPPPFLRYPAPYSDLPSNISKNLFYAQKLRVEDASTRISTHTHTCGMRVHRASRARALARYTHTHTHTHINT